MFKFKFFKTEEEADDWLIKNSPEMYNFTRNESNAKINLGWFGIFIKKCRK